MLYYKYMIMTHSKKAHLGEVFRFKKKTIYKEKCEQSRNEVV